MSKRALGTLLVAISAIAFGSYSYFALLATNAGIGPVPLLFYRFGIATAILAFIAFLSKSRIPKGRNLLPFIGLGVLYVGQSFTYLQCLRASNPITASLLLYLYPALVTVGSVLFLHERLTPTKVAALVCAFLGSVLIIGPVGGISVAAVLYGIGTATFYATYLVAGKKYVEQTSPVGSTLVIIGTAMLAYGMGSIFVGFDRPAQGEGWVGVVGLAVVATVIAIGGLLAGLRWTTAVEASSLSALEPLVSALIAVTVLHQALRIWHVVGGGLVIVAVLILARRAADSKGEGER